MSTGVELRSGNNQQPPSPRNSWKKKKNKPKHSWNLLVVRIGCRYLIPWGESPVFFFLVLDVELKSPRVLMVAKNCGFWHLLGAINKEVCPPQWVCSLLESQSFLLHWVSGGMSSLSLVNKSDMRGEGVSHCCSALSDPCFSAYNILSLYFCALCCNFSESEPIWRQRIL